MKRFILAVTVVLAACGGTAATSAVPSSSTVPVTGSTPAGPPSAQAWDCAQTVKEAEYATDEATEMLEAYVKVQKDPLDATSGNAMLDHMNQARAWAVKVIRGLPDGYESDPKLKDFADKTKTLMNLVSDLGWTPSEIAAAGSDLIDATGALDC